MNIIDIQVQKTLNKILSELLKKGNNPTDKTLTYMLKEYFKERLPGLPSLQVKEAVDRKLSSSDDYNEMLEEIEDDLNTVFTALNEQNKELLNNFATNENSRIKLMREIKELQNEIHKVLSESSKDNDYLYAITENFSSFKNIDLAKTDAFIDIKEKQVLLNIFNRTLKVIPLNKAKITINKLTPSEEAYSEELSNIDFAIDDYLNTFWTQKISYKKENQPKEVALELIIDMKDEYKISEIGIIPQSPSPMELEFYYNKNNAWVRIKTDKRKIENKRSWFFNPINTSKIKIVLTKTKADVADNVVSYIFGLKNISLGYRQYKSKSTLTTKPISLESKNNNGYTINKISIETDDEIPLPECDIKYFIQLKENNNLFKDGDFNNPSAWSANKFYSSGGVDGGSYCGDDTNWGFYQDVELIKGMPYTISGYVRMPADAADVRISAGSDNLGNHYVSTNGKWTYFEYTAIAQKSGNQRIYILDRKKEGHEVQADKFSIVTGEVANDESYGDSIPLTPINKNDKRYKQEVTLNNVGEEIVSFKNNKLSPYGESKYGKQYYSYSLSKKPLLDEIAIYKGVNKWELAAYQRRFPIEKPIGLHMWNKNKRINFNSKLWGYLPLFNSFENNYVDSISFDTNSTTGACKHYKFTTYIYCKDPQEYTSPTIDSRYSYNSKILYANNESLYINDEKVKKRGSKKSYSYKSKFKTGWNKIVITFYIDNPETDIKDWFDKIIDLSKIKFTAMRACKKAMKEISLTELYSLPYHMDNYFAIDKQNNIIFNNIDGDSGIKNNEYYINYKYNLNKIDTVKVIAELSSENPYKTPKIHEIKINARH